MSEEPFERMLYSEGEKVPQPDAMPLVEFLDLLEVHRDSIIMELRAVDKVLIRYGRLKGETVPRRIK